MKNTLFLFLVTLFLPVLVAEETPKVFLEHRVDQLLEVLKSSDSFEKKKTDLGEIFRTSFDMVQLSGMALGRESWLSLKTDEKKAFISKYTEFILSFYTSNMDGYNGEGLSMGEATLKSKGKKAVVPFSIIVDGKSVAMTYSLKKSKSNGWKIYDVEVEGVRLSTQYRNQFTSIIKKKGFEGLLIEMDHLIKKQSKTQN